MRSETNRAEETQRSGEYLDKRQLAAYLGVSIRTIANLMLRGLPHIKLTSKLTRFPRAAVDDWLVSRQIGGRL